jgi:hypothetical protein
LSFGCNLDGSRLSHGLDGGFGLECADNRCFCHVKTGRNIIEFGLLLKSQRIQIPLRVVDLLIAAGQGEGREGGNLQISARVDNGLWNRDFLELDLLTGFF